MNNTRKKQTNHFNELQTLIKQNKNQLEVEKKDLDNLNNIIFNRGSEINRLQYEANQIEMELKKQK